MRLISDLDRVSQLVPRVLADVTPTPLVHFVVVRCREIPPRISSMDVSWNNPERHSSRSNSYSITAPPVRAEHSTVFLATNLESHG